MNVPELDYGDAPDAMILDSALNFAQRETDLKALRERRLQLPSYDPDIVVKMSELGWYGVLVPQAYGGMDLRFADMAAIAEALGKGLLAEPLIATGVMGVRALLHGDNEALKQRLLPDAARGVLAIALAWQERGGTIGPEEIQTTAQRVPGGYRVTGKKRFVCGANATGYLVSALESGQLMLLWVSSDAAGLTVHPEWRADGTASFTLDLQNVAVVDAEVAAGPAVGARALARTLDETTVMVAAESQGVMSAALDITLAYMRTRVQFGKPIGSFQALQHRAAELMLYRNLAAASLAAAVRMLDINASDAQLRLAASRAKYRCSDAGMRIARSSIQLHGAIGFTDECDIGLYLKRAMVLSAWLGNAEVHKARVQALRPALAARAGEPSVSQKDAMRQFSEQMARPVEAREWNRIDDDVFREIASTFFRENLPAKLRFLPRRPGWDELKPWYLALSSNGWLAPAWPTVHGGMGLEPAKLMIYHEEMGRSGAPRHLEQGINYIGPLLIARGSDEQKAKYLPRILSGEHLWCQGYSEPNSGSDLASLRTKAVLDGDEFVVDGQKIWTTMAHHANHMYALVRTEPNAERHAGISLLLIDMKQPGLTVRPIRNIAGHEEFCEVFLDGVRTPRENLVGDLNDGWNVARTLLGFERNTVGSPRTCLAALERIEIALHTLNENERAIYAARLTEGWLDVADLASMYERFVQAVKAGARPGFEVSVMKIWATETLQRLTELLVDLLGDAGCLQGYQDFQGISVDVLTPFLDSRSTTISAGSSEVQRNVLAKRVLNL